MTDSSRKVRKSFPLLFSCLCLFLLVPILLSCCARRPLAPVPEECLPDFADDLHYASLKEAVNKNLDYLRNQDPLKKIYFADREYPISTLIRSQELFLKLLSGQPSTEELNQRIREYFTVYQATGTRGINLRRKMLVTGYYQPVFEGSLQKKEPFIYPLYTIPPDLVERISPEGQRVIGRMDGANLLPYWTREEIETMDKAAGSEIVWLSDPFDVFALHVQGSGLIRLRDGSLRGIHYAAKNGRQYKSIGRYMVETGRIRLEDSGMKTIRKYLADHPDERDEILHHNPSFIFFKWSDTMGALGSLGEELTPGRSIAVDQQCFPPGSLGFLFSRIPVVTDDRITTWKNLQRFMVVQDTGSAIRGPGRVDVFLGSGPEAGVAAGEMKEYGNLYFFLPKENSL